MRLDGQIIELDTDPPLSKSEKHQIDIVIDRLVVRPAQVIGVVDVAEIYRLKEAEFAALMTRGNSDADRQQAMDLATSFARRLPRALEELPADCRCLVVLKSAVAGPTARTLDLTAVLKTKVDAR